MKKVVWLASYPKSGNTWVRIFFTSLLKKDTTDGPLINDLLAPILSSRNRIEEYLMLETSELSQDEIEAYTPLALKEMAREIERPPFFFKAHDAYIYTQNKEPLYPTEISMLAIYIVRNPLDVCISFAHHNNSTVDDTIKIMGDNNFAFLSDKKTVKRQVRQKLLNWSGHVKSWRNQHNIPVLVIRYEDMLDTPFDTFKEMVKQSGLTATDTEIADAIDKSSFEKLKEQEAKFGFQERRSLNENFFRKGKAGGWRESLTPEQAGQIITDHSEVMFQLGYLNAAGNPVY